jgi:hypothetical protein
LTQFFYARGIIILLFQVYPNLYKFLIIFLLSFVLSEIVIVMLPCSLSLLLLLFLSFFPFFFFFFLIDILKRNYKLHQLGLGNPIKIQIKTRKYKYMTKKVRTRAQCFRRCGLINSGHGCEESKLPIKVVNGV